MSSLQAQMTLPKTEPTATMKAVSVNMVSYLATAVPSWFS
jgi:hypothetical protein